MRTDRKGKINNLDVTVIVRFTLTEMARSNNNTLLLFVVVAVLVIFGVYCAWGGKFDSQGKKDSGSESYANSKKLRGSSQSDIEFLVQADVARQDAVDDFQLLGVADEEPAFQIGFGMGPGLYGSGRHTSEMVGN